MKRWEAKLMLAVAVSLLTSLVLVSGKPPARPRANANSTALLSERSRQRIGSGTEPAEMQAEAQVDFVAPVSVGEALAVAAQQNLKVTQVRHSFTVGGEKFVGFYVVDADDTPATVGPNLAAKYREFLQNIASPLEVSFPDAAPADPVAGDKQKRKSIQAEQALVESYQDEVRIDGIIVVGAEGQIDAVKDASHLVSKVTAKPPEQERASARSSSKGGAPAQAAAQVDELTWVPVSGRIITGESSNSSRYVKQEMRWSNVSGFGPNSTYEHDFFLKNSAGEKHGPGTYLDRTDIFTDDKQPRMPKVEYYSSNLPAYYLDTRFLDGTLGGLLGTDEVAFTIGSAQANKIKADTDYTSYISTKKGDVDVDDGKLQAQLGHRDPTSCYTTMCSYGDQMAPLVPAWDVPVPGTLNWSRKVATPVIEPGSLSSLGSVTARMSTATSGATIRYTTNGSDPTSGSTVYSGPMTFSSSVTLKARAFKSGHPESDVATASYSIVNKAATPSISPGSLSSTSPVTASISTTTAGATIRYTINGTDPTGSSSVYSGPLTFNSSVTLKARAFKSGMTESGVTAASYTVKPPPPLSASCSISPSPITLGQGATVSANASGGVGTYRYRINGVDMGTKSSLAVSPSKVGTFSTNVTVTDSRNSQASDSCSVQVVATKPSVTQLSYSPNPAKVNKVVNLDIYGDNFASNAQVWFVGPECGSPGCQTVAVNTYNSGRIGAAVVLKQTGTYTVNIRNGTGAWVKAGTIKVVK